jgi:hypothetical protein
MWIRTTFLRDKQFLVTPFVTRLLNVELQELLFWHDKIFIYCDATRDNSKFKLFHQQPNFVYSKTTFALGAVAESIPIRY